MYEWMSQWLTSEIYEVCPKSTQPCTSKNRDIYWKRCKIQETLYLGQWCLSPLQSRPVGTSQFSQSSSASLSYFPEFHQGSETSPLSEVILVLGKARSHRVPNLGHSGAESPGWFDVLPKNSAWHVMQEWAHCCDEAAISRCPSCGLLNHPDSFHGGMFKLNA